MKKIKEQDKNNIFYKILDGLDAYVYITDPQTHEILFINKKMEKHFGDKLTGKVCWQVLQSGMSGPCDFCPIKNIVNYPLTPVFWEEHNTVTKRFYSNTDTTIEWFDGEYAHLQHSVDITNIKLAELEKKKQYEQQNLLFELSMAFASTDSLAAMARNALLKVRNYFGVSGAYIMKYDREKGKFAFAYGATKEGGNKLNSIDKYEIDCNLHLSATLKYGEPVIFNCNDATAPLTADSEYCVAAPLMERNNLWGILYLDSLAQKIDVNDSDFAQLKIIGNFIVTGLERKAKEEALIARDRQLREALDTAEKANKAKSEFLSRMSHEIRTPISAIMGITYIAQNAKSADKIQNCLDKIDSSSKHLLGIINDILDMSKIEADKLELISEDFNFENMLTETCNLVAVKLTEKKQNLSINVANSIRTNYRGDSLRLSQVITNLLTNAIKFAPENSTINLNVTGVGSVDGKTTLEFEVRDNGIGISPEHLKRLFTPFEQADGSISRKFGGTGLGLAISKKIVNLMGGEIQVESTEGKGSTFRFTVVLKDSSTTSTPELSPSIDKDKLRILVVNSNLKTIKLYTELAVDAGIKMVAANSCNEALQLIKTAKETNKPYDIVFMNWHLPDISGIEAAKALSLKTGKSNIIVVKPVSEWALSEKDAQDAGIIKFLSNPLFPSAVIDAVNEVFGVKHASDIAQQCVPDFSGKRILLAEDVEVNVEIIRAMLSDTNVEIKTAANGVEVVKLFKEENFDLILMDIQMPLMDGYEAALAIRALSSEKAKSVNIIAMTANVFEEDMKKCRESGMNDHISKPVEEKILMKKIEQYIKNNGGKTKERVSETDNYKEFLPYIDVLNGLSRLRNNKKLYAKLLKSYLNDANFKNICTPIKANNMEAAKEAVHSLKGTSANLSLMSTYELLKLLEIIIKENNDAAPALLDLQRIMSTTARMIEKLIVRPEFNS